MKQKLLLIFLCVMCSGVSFGAENDVQLLESFSYSGKPMDSPAHYALNQLESGKFQRACNILDGKQASTEKEREESRKYLRELKKKIELGMNWPIKSPPSFNIPFTDKKPVIDGGIEESCWQKALTLYGEYPVNSTEQSDKSSKWMLMYNKQYIYVGASFKDAGLLAVDYLRGEGGPWQGDSIEVFIMPSSRLKDYREVVLGVGGALFSSLHVNNKWGTFINGDETENVKTIKAKSHATTSGFSLELAIPFKDLPNYMLGNRPQPGETIYFALIRTNKNKNDENVKFYSAFPLLYAGHNIYGYAKGILK